MGRLRQLVVFGFAILANPPLGAAAGAGVAWTRLETYQDRLSRKQFETALDRVYCPSGAIRPYLALTDQAVSIYPGPDRATSPNPLAIIRFRSEPLPAHPAPPLESIHVAIDPGHIGGAWARMEERYFVRGADRPVMEGVLTLLVARQLRRRLEMAGVQVSLTRDRLEPVTDKRPLDFFDSAMIWARGLGRWEPFPPLEREAVIADAARKRAELLFYRSAEIRARAENLNRNVKPDLTLAVHFNAVPWNDCRDLVDANRVLFFVHGCYTPNEIEQEDQRLRLLEKLFGQVHQTEIPLAEEISRAFVAATGLPPAGFEGENVVAVGDHRYVYARNLAANRLIDGPVIYLEPYFMNSRLVYQRLQAGDYEGEQEFDGRLYPSIFREYVDAVVTGLRRYYGSDR